MPALIAGGDSGTASERDLAIFGLCCLIDKRDASKSQLNIIAFSIFCMLMASWGLKTSFAASCILLVIAIAFAFYALYYENQTLRQIQRELRSLLWNTPTSDVEQFFQDANDLHAN